MTTLELRVFDQTGATLRGYITRPISASFLDEFNGNGQGSVTTLLDGPDGALLRKDALIRVYYKGVCAYAFVVETLDRVLTSGEERRTVTASGRGVLSWMDDAIVYPQAGLKASYASTDRMFNFAGSDGQWVVDSGFREPVAVRWRDDDSIRKGFPKKWPDPQASWIWATDPTRPVPAGETNWFRSTFNLDKSARVRFWCAADNRYEVYLDGSPLFVSTSAKTQDVSWAQLLTKTVKVPAGQHVVAARVQNEKPYAEEGVRVDEDGWFDLDGPFGVGDKVVLSGVGKSGLDAGRYFVVKKDPDSGVQISDKSGGSPVKPVKAANVNVEFPQDSTAGFIMSAYTLDSKNRPDQLVERTNAKGWLVTDTEPGWEPAEMVWACLGEARRRGVSRLDALSKGWTAKTDSYGNPWTVFADTTVPVGTTVTEVADYGVNLGIDYWVNPETLRMEASEERGRDVSETVRLDLAYNLLTYATTEERTLKTTALVRTKDGWTEQRWMDEFYGRRETMVTVERTRSRITGRRVADKALRALGRRRVVAQTADATPVDGAEPYVTFTVGDIVSVPNAFGRLGQRNRARVLSLSMSTDGETVSYSMEVEVLGVEKQ